ncbi:MAG: carboxylating nicotinate-nucleotide diphosphorylase [Leptospiraceae bacterium]|nr:carboxylating nicotinate-nucleotide diphosphorylase [Leptospiraceae bacterium]
MERYYTNPVNTISPEDFEPLLTIGLSEDCPTIDITSESIFSNQIQAKANLVTREDGIFCGSQVLSLIQTKFPNEFFFEILKQEGSEMKSAETLVKLEGKLNTLLRVERILLNLLQYLSGIATNVHQLVKQYPNLLILDTRKTLPGYRKLVKYAVYTGGGANHRLNLSDMGLIKDNHVTRAGSITLAVNSIREKFPDKKIELEIDGLHQLEEAIRSNPDIILLDNFSIEDTKTAVEAIRAKSSIRIECSGGITPEKLSSLSTLGDIGVSMGYLTHTTRFLDLSLELEEL